MKMDKVAGSQNDEFYTPTYAIKPLIKYINPESTIWCPFDTEDSNFYKIFSKHCKSCAASHLSNGSDFFTVSPPEGTTHILSNPPYSLKFEVFNRLFQLKIPFAMLVGVVGLFESQKRFTMFENNDFEIMYMDKRISYFKSFLDEKPSLNPPFSSVYLCSQVLPKPIVFERIVSKS